MYQSFTRNVFFCLTHTQNTNSRKNALESFILLLVLFFLSPSAKCVGYCCLFDWFLMLIFFFKSRCCFVRVRKTIYTRMEIVRRGAQMMDDGQIRACGLRFLPLALILSILLVCFNDRLSFINANAPMKLRDVFLSLLLLLSIKQNSLDASDQRWQRWKMLLFETQIRQTKIYIAANASNWCLIYWFSATNYWIYNFLIVRQLDFIISAKRFERCSRVSPQYWNKKWTTIHVSRR